MVDGSAPYIGAFGQGVFGKIARSGGSEDEQSENKGHSMPQLGLVESSPTSDILVAITE